MKKWFIVHCAFGYPQVVEINAFSIIEAIHMSGVDIYSIISVQKVQQ